jgi:opacity protein-like surface antigen
MSHLTLIRVATLALASLAASAQAADAAKPVVNKLPSGVEVTHLTVGSQHGEGSLRRHAGQWHGV